jgi:glucose uptake protein GlcU
VGLSTGDGALGKKVSGQSMAALLNAVPAMPSLTMKQWLFCLAYGCGLAIGATFLVRTLGPMGYLTGWPLAIGYAVLVPVTLPAVLLTQKVMGPFKDQAMLGVAIISAIALLVPGIGFGFFPDLYGTKPEHIIGAAGFLLWGGGVGLVLGLFVGKGR